MAQQPHRLEFTVRDYECDLAGMVNNANYLHYLEHARHQFLKQRGVDFAALAADGLYLVVIRVELDYLLPLRSGDRFYVTTQARRISRLRIGLDQAVFHLPDEKPALKGLVVTSGINAQGRPHLPETLVTCIVDRAAGPGQAAHA